jgi:hypothetical protein
VAQGESEVLTVLFTDLVGSTTLLSTLGDDAADELRRAHFTLLRSAITAHRGREIKNLGDGLMVAFSSAREAVACAAAMQVAANAHSDRLELRVGIDAGEPINENGDLFGTPVVVAQPFAVGRKRRRASAARRMPLRRRTTPGARADKDDGEEHGGEAQGGHVAYFEHEHGADCRTGEHRADGQ